MSSAVQLIRSTDLAAAPYAYAATAPAGSRLIFLAGSCPLEDDGTTTAPGDYAAQAARCMETLQEALRASGAALTDVISTRVLVASTSQADLVTAWDVIHEGFGSHDVPSTLLGVTVLGYDHQLVEIEAVAAIAEDPR
ncbi:RidA family protein [Microbacterium sp. C5A9]|uniref:RidA family protein n=1 Tax=Microbacterium sp. C5A9 TaxID=2736663 RepID=UPI001F51E72B|nr:Rid family hydrolase [Microbacterium sp. C5A9]MCI1020073.1 RidA family protein [Microbacterium sp. C5A9]